MKACSNSGHPYYCDGELGDHSEHDECVNCRRRRERWKEEKPEKVRSRVHQCARWGMSALVALPKSERERETRQSGPPTVLTLAANGGAARRRA